MKHIVEVWLVAKTRVHISVDREADECPCDLDETEKAKAINEAWGDCEWRVEKVREETT